MHAHLLRRSRFTPASIIPPGGLCPDKTADRLDQSIEDTSRSMPGGLVSALNREHEEERFQPKYGHGLGTRRELFDENSIKQE